MQIHTNSISLKYRWIKYPQFYLPAKYCCFFIKTTIFPLPLASEEILVMGPFTNYVDKILAFLPYERVDRKSTFLDYLPPSSFKHSMWTTPIAILGFVELVFAFSFSELVFYAFYFVPWRFSLLYSKECNGNGNWIGLPDLIKKVHFGIML